MPYAIEIFSSDKILGFIDGLKPVIGTLLILSTPAAMTRSDEPDLMRSAALETDWRPEEQNLLRVYAGVESGRPASKVAIRAMFNPCGPSGMAQPTIISSILLFIFSLESDTLSTLCIA
jgi:hypothetical protein